MKCNAFQSSHEGATSVECSAHPDFPSHQHCANLTSTCGTCALSSAAQLLMLDTSAVSNLEMLRRGIVPLPSSGCSLSSVCSRGASAGLRVVAITLLPRSRKRLTRPRPTPLQRSTTALMCACSQGILQIDTSSCLPPVVLYCSFSSGMGAMCVHGGCNSPMPTYREPPVTTTVLPVIR